MNFYILLYAVTFGYIFGRSLSKPLMIFNGKKDISQILLISYNLTILFYLANVTYDSQTSNSDLYPYLTKGTYYLVFDKLIFPTVEILNASAMLQ